MRTEWVGVLVPEATVDEDRSPEFWQEHVRAARQVAGMYAVAKACCVEVFAYPYLGLGVSPGNVAHNSATGLVGDCVDHH